MCAYSLWIVHVGECGLFECSNSAWIAGNDMLFSSGRNVIDNWMPLQATLVEFELLRSCLAWVTNLSMKIDRNYQIQGHLAQAPVFFYFYHYQNWHHKVAPIEEIMMVICSCTHSDEFRVLEEPSSIVKDKNEPASLWKIVKFLKNYWFRGISGHYITQV